MATYPDVVVVIPGIMGSTLLDHDGREIWGLRAGTLVRGLLTLARGVRRLGLPDGIGDGPAGDGVTPGTLLPDLHVIPGLWTISVGYSTLLGHLRRTHEVVEFAYDWRLSNRHSARLLKSTVEPALARQRERHADAKLVFVCHSMGGLIARWYVDREGGAELTRSLITIGTPHRGAASAIDRLVNGVHKGLGPFALDLTGVARSLPSLHQLLPDYACVEDGGGLRRITDGGLPELVSTMVTDGVAFHEELDAAVRSDPGYQLHPLVGFRHPTATTVRIAGSRAVMVRTIEGEDEKGDSTVPRLSAVPRGWLVANPAAVHHVDDTHTALPGNVGVLNQIDGILTAQRVEHLAVEVPIGVTVDELVVAGEPVTVTAELDDPHVLVFARVVDAASGALVDSAPLRVAGERLAVTFDGLPPGAYRVVVGRGGPARLLDTVTTATVVLDPAALNEDR